MNHSQNSATVRAASLQAKFKAHAPKTAPVAAEAELMPQSLIDTAPAMRDTIETLRGLLAKFVSGTASVHEDGTVIDALVRSRFVLQRADGVDTTAAIAAYEASLLEAPDDDDSDDDDFGRYGACDDYPDVDPYRD